MAEFQKITPFLWLDGAAREAAEFYVSIFKNSRIVSTHTYGDGPATGSSTVAFELDGVQFVAFDGIPAIEFTEAISFMVSCESQDEIDHLWDNLTDGGTEIQCGWLKDRFGVTWQIIPQRPSRYADGRPQRQPGHGGDVAHEKAGHAKTD